MDPNAIGVLLVAGRNGEDGAVGPYAVRRVLKKHNPDLHVVALDDRKAAAARVVELVRSRGIRGVVIAGWAPPSQLAGLARAAHRGGVEPFAVQVVALGATTSGGGTGLRAIKKASLKVLAELGHLECFDGVPRENIRALPKLRGNIGRRDLLTFLSRREIEAVPAINREACTAWLGCRLCVESCHLNAISAVEVGVAIDSDKCDTCGKCIQSCPQGAVCFPAYTPDQMDARLRGLLSPLVEGLDGRAVVFTCGDRSQGASDPTRGEPDNVFRLEVPCLGMVSAYWILRAFELGAAAVALLPCGGRCRHGFDLVSSAGVAGFCRELLGRIGIEPSRLRVLAKGRAGDEDCDRRLEVLLSLPSECEPTSLGQGGAQAAEPRPSGLPEVVGRLCRRLETSERFAVAHPHSPQGLVEIDESRCSACGICAERCPTGALTMNEDASRLSLTYRHAGCVPCRVCEAVCPEDALHVEGAFDLLRALSAGREVLKVSFPSRCRICGHTCGSESMVVKVAERLGGAPGATALDLCPSCRVAVAVSPPSATPDGQRRLFDGGNRSTRPRPSATAWHSRAT